MVERRHPYPLNPAAVEAASQVLWRHNLAGTVTWEAAEETDKIEYRRLAQTMLRAALDAWEPTEEQLTSFYARAGRIEPR